MKIKLTQFIHDDKIECFNLIDRIVIDGFIEEGVNITKEKNHLNSELEIQKKRIEQFPDNYYIAKDRKIIVGMIAYMRPCKAVELAAEKLKIDIKLIQEIVAVYVHPHYQRRGIGSMLFDHIINILQNKKTVYFSVSTGYKKGRSFWTKKLGQESVLLPTYYDGHPCNVWIRKIDSII